MLIINNAVLTLSKNGPDEIYYFNFQTGESSWDHPCDKYYVELLERERAKKRSKGITSKTKKSTQHQHTPSVKPLIPGTAKLQVALCLAIMFILLTIASYNKLLF